MSANYDKLVPALKALLSAERLDLLGRALRFIRRRRRVEASALVWAVVLSRFSSGHPGFAAARKWYRRLTGRSCESRPFQLRMKSPALVSLASQAFEEAVAPWRGSRRVNHVLAKHFADVVLVDSTLVRLADCLRSRFKGLRGIPAQMKALLAVSGFGLVPLFAHLYAGSVSDSKIFPPLRLFRARTLWLFDRGFLVFRRMREIDEHGQYFLCPIKKNTNAVVVAQHLGPSRARRAIRTAPRRLRDLLPAGKKVGNCWDLDVHLTSHKRGQSAPVVARLVIVPGPAGEQRGYLTNLPREAWAPRLLRELYRLRWQIELVFKELKQHLNLESIPTKDVSAAQTFVWASLIALAVSRAVASWLAPLAQMVGLASPLHLPLVSRALRANARLLVPMVRKSLNRPASFRFFAELLRDGLLEEATRRHKTREDSFARLADGLLAAA